MKTESTTTCNRYQHARRDRTSGRFTPNYSSLSEPLCLRLRPQVAAALRKLVMESGVGISFAVDALLGEQLRVATTGGTTPTEPGTDSINPPAGAVPLLAGEDTADDDDAPGTLTGAKDEVAEPTAHPDAGKDCPQPSEAASGRRPGLMFKSGSR